MISSHACLKRMMCDDICPLEANDVHEAVSGPSWRAGPDPRESKLLSVFGVK